MKPDTRPGPQAKYSKHIVADRDKELRSQVVALKNALRGTLYMFEGRATTKADQEQIAFGYKILRDAK